MSSSRKNLYTGRSGQLAVMAEFLMLGYNVAVPEVDIGDDIFVVKDSDGALSRIQVKTANARELKAANRCSAHFNVPLDQLKTAKTPEITYVFVLRRHNRWSEFVVIAREKLYGLYADPDNKIGTVSGTGSKQSLVLRFRFSDADVLCGSKSMNSYRNQWSQWKPIEH